MADVLMAVTCHLRMYPSSIQSLSHFGWQVAAPGGKWQDDARSKGNRRPDDWRGHFFQVSGLGHQVPASGIQVQVQVRELSHRPISGGGWQPRVAGGGRSAICPLSSMQSSIQPSTQSSIQSSSPPAHESSCPQVLETSVLFSSGPLSSANVLPLHSSASRRPDAA